MPGLPSGSLDQLITFICESPSRISRALSIWGHTNRSFEVFVRTYRTKMRTKVRRCKNDERAQDDLLWEFDIAHLLLKNSDFRIEYEPYTTGARSPDFRVHLDPANSFNLEATQIRRSAAEERFRICEREIKNAIQAVPSGVGVTLDIGGPIPDPKLLDVLESRLTTVIAAVSRLIV